MHMQPERIDFRMICFILHQTPNSTRYLQNTVISKAFQGKCSCVEGAWARGSIFMHKGMCDNDNSKFSAKLSCRAFSSQKIQVMCLASKSNGRPKGDLYFVPNWLISYLWGFDLTCKWTS